MADMFSNYQGPGPYDTPFLFKPSAKYNYSADHPVWYQPIIQTRDILNEGLVGMMDQQLGRGNPYANSPILASLRGTAGALANAPGQSGLRGQMPSWGGNSNLFQQEMAAVPYGAYRQAAAAMPEYYGKLLEALMKSYQSAANIFASEEGNRAKRHQIETGAEQAKMDAWGQIPIIGGLLGGML